MSKVRRKHSNHTSCPPIREVYNPFLDTNQTNYHERQAKKSPKHSKRVGKCFQLVLICQKLLKPFSNSTKIAQPDIIKKEVNNREKTKFNQASIEYDRLPIQPTIPKPCKVDAWVQTNSDSFPDLSQMVLEDGYDTNQGSEDFPYDIDEPLKEPYWDLDIDSAIVGDFNSTSSFSLDEQIDPHYATIKMAADGTVIDKPQCVTEPTFFPAIYPNEKISCSNSCTSSPKSGVYSKILKPRNTDVCDPPMSDYYRLHTGSRLNFERIMSIRSQLGLGYNFPGSESSICPAATPDIPLRNYGSSVINYVATLRQHDSIPHSFISSSMLFQDQKQSSVNIYSPIWITERSPIRTVVDHLVMPTSEPVASKRSLNKILHQLNPTYHDDSSEDTSSISFNSPSKTKYSYPRNFSENCSSKYYPCPVDGLDRFRHVDSERRLLRGL